MLSAPRRGCRGGGGRQEQSVAAKVVRAPAGRTTGGTAAAPIRAPAVRKLKLSHQSGPDQTGPSKGRPMLYRHSEYFRGTFNFRRQYLCKPSLTFNASILFYCRRNPPPHRELLRPCLVQPKTKNFLEFPVTSNLAIHV